MRGGQEAVKGGRCEMGKEAGEGEVGWLGTNRRGQKWL